MNTPIFRTLAVPLVIIIVVLSLIVLLRGHNAPGGGFIGGLMAASAAALHAMAYGVRKTRQRLRVDPPVIAGLGVVVAGLAGLLSLPFGYPFLTGLWLPGYIFGVAGLFDVGVYLVVFGALTALALALEDDEGAA